MFSSSPEKGEAREELDVKYEGVQVELGYNAKYILDCLQVMESLEIELRFKDRLSPGTMNEAGQRSYNYIIMPMRI